MTPPALPREDAVDHDVMVEVAKLGKRYELYSSPGDRLRQMVLPRVSRAMGRTGRNYFREFWALHEVSLNVRRGDTVGIIGQNGSGKSTLLQIICGTLYPTTGHVRTGGKVAALLELGAGFNPEFSGEENVYLSGKLYGLSDRQLAERFDAIVAFAEIGDFVRQPVKTYSSGMYVRLAFAIAAHVDADILVVDEALSVGDARFTQKCMRFLRAFQQQGTLLFVSHDVGAVVGLCSRAIWMHKGRVNMEGPAKDVVEAYLAEQHAEDRKGDGAVVKTAVRSAGAVDRPALAKDTRAALQQRNPLEVYAFDPDHGETGFGAGGARIVDMRLLDDKGEVAHLLHGGEMVTLEIRVHLNTDLSGLIFGFYVKDRLGQRLFGDNTFVSHADTVKGTNDDAIRARFSFRMPVLPVGTYTVDGAVAAGSQSDHTQHHWLLDGLTFRAVDSTMKFGLVGIPMLAIDVEKEAATT